MPSAAVTLPSRFARGLTQGRFSGQEAGLSVCKRTNIRLVIGRKSAMPPLLGEKPSRSTVCGSCLLVRSFALAAGYQLLVQLTSDR